MKEHRLTLVADSGSTKTEWALGEHRLLTQGINPFHQDEDTIRGILRNELLPQLKPLLQPKAPLEAPSNLPQLGEAAAPVFSAVVASPSWGRLEGASKGARRLEGALFYGSGVRPELESKMTSLLREVFPTVEHIEAHSDLLGAARALCGHHEGIACILGTGANSCLYDGEHIVSNTPPLGYILGDEGSGAVLGARFLNALYKHRLSDDLRREFEEWAGMGLAEVISRVYRQPLANRWLASLSPFIHDHIADESLSEMVVCGFRDFISRNVAPYCRQDLPLSAVGSVAYYYREQLHLAADAEGYALGTILRSPLDNLSSPSF